MQVRIYYEDTDAGGVVYHANYLRYFERARTEFMRERGISVKGLHDQGIIFPVVGMDISYRAPARLDDLLEVRTELGLVKNSSLVLEQTAVRADDGKVLVQARVTLACVGEGMRARRVPQELRDRLSAG